MKKKITAFIMSVCLVAAMIADPVQAASKKAYIKSLKIPASLQLAVSKENDHAEWGQVPEQTAYEVYRILQEQLTNILKHSYATELNINLS